MIKVGRISDISEAFDEHWLVVRSLRNGVPASAKHVPLLSPSPALFRQYFAVKRLGGFNEKWFDDVYVLTFLRELGANRQALVLMDQLYRDSFGRNILLACFCTDERLCHRSILAGMLLGAGARIECRQEYVKYHRMFLDRMNGAA